MRKQEDHLFRVYSENTLYCSAIHNTGSYLLHIWEGSVDALVTNHYIVGS